MFNCNDDCRFSDDLKTICILQAFLSILFWFHNFIIFAVASIVFAFIIHSMIEFTYRYTKSNYTKIEIDLSFMVTYFKM